MKGRIRKGLYGLVVALVVVGVLLHTPPAKRFVTSILTRAAAARLGASVALEQLDYRLWLGQAHLRNLVVRSDDSFELTVEAIHVDWSPFRGVSAVLATPRLTLRQSAGTLASGGEMRAEAAVPPFLTRLELRNGALVVSSKVNEMRLEVVGMEATVAAGNGKRTGTLHFTAARAAHLSPRLSELALGPGDVSFAFGDRGIEVTEAVIKKDGSQARARGVVAPGFDVDLDMDFQLDTRALRELSPAWEVSGQIEGRAKLTGNAQTLRITAGFGSPVLDAPGFGTWALDGELEWHDRVLTVSRVHLQGYGGRIVAAGRFDAERGTLSVDAHGSGIETGAVGQIWGTALPVNGRIGADLKLDLTSWDLNGMIGNGRLVLEPVSGQQSIPIEGIIELTAQPGSLHLESSQLRLADGGVKLQATLRADLGFSASYEASWTDIRQLAPLLNHFDVPRPEIQGNVSLHGRASGSIPDPSSRVASLTVRSDRLVFRDELFRLDADLQVTETRLVVEELVLRGAEGYLSARGVVPLEQRGGAIEITGSVDGLGISELARILEIPLEGTADGHFEVIGDIRDPDFAATVRFHPLTLHGISGEGGFAVRKRGRTVLVEELQATLGAAGASIRGMYELDTRKVSGQIQAHDFRWNDLFPGKAQFDGTVSSLVAEVQGVFPAMEGRAEILLGPMSFRGAVLPSCVIEANSDGRSLQVNARIAGEAHLATAQVELVSPYQVAASVDLSVLPLDVVVGTLLSSTSDDTRLTARGRLDISFPALDLDRLEYRARVDQMVGRYRSIAGGSSSEFVIDGDSKFVTIHNLDLVGTGTAIAVDGRIPLTSDGDFDLDLRGSARLDILELFTQEAALAGEAGFILHLGGRAAAPLFDGELTVENGALTWGRLGARDLTLDMVAEEGRVVLRSLAGTSLGGTFQVSGQSPLPRPSAAEPARLEIQIIDVDVAEIRTDEEKRAINPLILVSGSGSFEASDLEISRIRGAGQVSTLLTSLGDIVIENSEPVPWLLEDGRLSIERMNLVGGDTNLDVDLHTQRSGETWNWLASIEGDIDNTYVNPLVQMAWDAVVAGVTKLDFEVGATDGTSRIRGRASLNGARLIMREPPLALTRLSGEMSFDDQSITLSGLEATAGGGRVRASGGIQLVDFTTIRDLNFGLEVESVSFEYPMGMQTNSSGSARLTGEPGALVLSGDVRLLEGLFSRDLALETGFLDTVKPATVVRTDEVPFAETVRLDLGVLSEQDIRIDNNLARAQASVNLRIAGTAATPEVDGVLTARPDGTFRLGRNLFRIESGTVLMRGYPFEPVELNIAARTSVSGVDIVLRLKGTTDNLVTELEAPDEADLSPGDIASLLVTGRTLYDVSDLDRLSGQERKVLEEQLVAYVGGTLANIAQQGLGKALPFDQISVSPAELGTEVDPELRFTLGKALTENLFVTYSIGLENSQSQLWIVDYQLPKRLAFRVTRREDNRFSGTLSQKLQFDFPGRPKREPQARTSAKIAAVEIEGAPPELAAPLSRKIALSRGDRYDYWKAQEDIQRLTSSLRDKAYLNAFVQADTSPSGDGLVEVHYRIEPGLPVRVIWEGEDPGDSVRKQVENSWDGRLPERFLLEELSTLATLELRRERFFTARVRTQASTGTDGAREIRFVVDKGPRGETIALDFEGNRVFTAADLRRALPSGSSTDFVELVFTDPGRLRETISSFYASRGYLDARVDEPHSSYDERTRVFRVVVSIEEGAPTAVVKIRFEGAVSFDESHLLHESKLAAGRPFDLTAFTDARSALASAYRREGFTEARVRGRLQSTEGGLELVFDIDEGPQVRVGEIRVVGNHASRRNLILRQLTFETGDPLRLSALTETQQKLYDLGIFRSVDVRAEPSPEDSSTRPVLVEVVEVADSDFGYGLRYSSEDGPELQTTVRFPNLLGSGEQIGLSVTVNRNDSTARASFLTPRLWRYQLDTGFFVARETNDEEFFTNRAWSFTFQQGKRLVNELNLRWSYTYRHSRTIGKIQTGPFPFDITTNTSILTTSVIEDRRDNVVQPSRGRFWNATLQYAPPGLGSDIQFIKFFGRLFTFVPLGEDIVWAGGYRLGIADAFDQRLLPEDRFLAGGPTTVRGFDQDSLGPREPITDTVIGGEAQIIINQEMRFPLYRWLQGVAFYDAGNVFLEAKDMSLADLRHSAGAGFRIVLPFGLLRFDWGWPLDRRPGEKAYQFWFNLYHAF